MNRTYLHKYSRKCRFCKKTFTSGNRAARYCSERCRTDNATANRDRRPNHWKNKPRKCRNCRKLFFPQSPNRRLCSFRCQVEGRRLNFEIFKKRHPGVQRLYNRQRGRDTLIIRLRKKFPDLPTRCEAKGCGESRVLDLAHKPKFKRNGAHRLLARYKRHMFWILCPTCHRVVDRGIETPQQMGLK